jgi:hypothetical protein
VRNRWNKTVPKWAQVSDRNKDGSLKAGETSWGQKAGQFLSTDPKAAATRKATADAAQVETAGLGAGYIQSHSGLAPEKLANTAHLSGLKTQAVGDTIAHGNKKQLLGMAAGIGAMKAAPANKEEFFNTVINNSIAAAGDACRSADEQGAARRILGSLATNEELVAKLEPNQLAQLMDFDDDKIRTNLLRSYSRSRGKAT